MEKETIGKSGSNGCKWLDLQRQLEVVGLPGTVESDVETLFDKAADKMNEA